MKVSTHKEKLMKKYRVMLTSLAKVSQSHYIEAESHEEAEAEALARVENSVWEYGGVIDDNIEIQSAVVRRVIDLPDGKIMILGADKKGRLGENQ